MFTDDINVDGLVDNNGRQVSEVYLTIVKRTNLYTIQLKIQISTITDMNIHLIKIIFVICT